LLYNPQKGKQFNYCNTKEARCDLIARAVLRLAGETDASLKRTLHSYNTMPEKFENASNTGHFENVFDETLLGKSHNYRDFIIFA